VKLARPADEPCERPHARGGQPELSATLNPGTEHRDGAKGRAVVTGASAGLGAAFARRLALDGFDVTLVARRRDRLEALAAELRERANVAVDVIAADLTVARELATVESALAGRDGLDLLVNNAGVLTVGRFAALDVDEEEALIRLNVVALTRLTRAALAPMLERCRGAIINVSSVAGLTPTRFTACYGASKAFIISFTHALDEELRGTGVRVQLLCPGFTRTDLGVPGGLQTQRLPAWMWMSPEAVAAASVAHLARRAHVCVPGAANKLLYVLLDRLPRPLVRRIVGVGAKRGWAATRQRETRT
jgi:uncharacterized protein